MADFAVSRLLEDDGRLDESGAVGFLRGKLEKGTGLDFTGVDGLSDGFFERLFRGMTPEEITARTAGQGEAFGRWLALRGGKEAQEGQHLAGSIDLQPTPAERPSSVPSAAAEPRYTPTRLFHRLRTTLRSYIESAYPLSDPILVQARRLLLDQDCDGHLLAQEPYIETTTRYSGAPASYADMGLPPRLATLFSHLANTPTQYSTADESRTILYPRMYMHQHDAYLAYLRDGRDMVVATGTGSGKTECFLIPIVGHLYTEAAERPGSFAQPGVRALILYPMNALVNDQLSRLRLLLGEPALAAAFEGLGPKRRFPRFGMYTGRTPYPGPRNASRDQERMEPLLKYYLDMTPALRGKLRRMGRYPAKELEAFYAKHEERVAHYASGKRAGEAYVQHNWKLRLHTGVMDRELLSRQEMVHGAGTQPGQSPDVLVTNYSMLEYMLMRPFERPIFDETARWLALPGSQLLLVLDEAHMYRGAKGAEVAFLIRRLRARLGIEGSPDRLRVIATSASLGEGSNAREQVKQFAADLTGKQPLNFETITGTREVPNSCGPATTEVGALFAALDIQGIHEAATPAALRAHLAALLPPALGDDNHSDTSVLSELYDALENQPYVNQLVAQAANKAQALGVLADAVFPGSADPLRALEALLTVSTLARRSQDEPGLVPTRVHGLFRGLQGVYACINPRCQGRQAGPGQHAPVGKLFATPRISCDSCGSRVFELASCRQCGSPYLFAHCESGQASRLRFLWGETEGALEQLQLLPLQPRYSGQTREIRTHLRTGYLDQAVAFPDDQVRSFYVATDDKGDTCGQFDRCPMCQPDGRGRVRIWDLRTRGEQPFTALIEAQFAEQPAQTRDPSLPNGGRKVLVFSDGRQKAARLAPTLEHTHARDLFRQVVALALEDLNASPMDRGLHRLYPAIVRLCALRHYDLFPAKDEAIFSYHVKLAAGKSLEQVKALSNGGHLQPTMSFAKALYDEVTDRFNSLLSLGLATLEESEVFEGVWESMPLVGLPAGTRRTIFRQWLRQHLERRSFQPDGATAAELSDSWGKPNGVALRRTEDILPRRFGDYLLNLMDQDPARTDLVIAWLRDTVVRDSGMFRQINDLYYLVPQSLRLRMDAAARWWRCDDCGRLHSASVAELCPACVGLLRVADADYLEARTGFYRDQLKRARDRNALEPFGLSAAEHSAQLTAVPDESAFNRVEEYELRFQDIRINDQRSIDVLSCTTTMEVGVDIGSLSGVALRNVPPHVANYQQRAGRAGRRGKSIASVITYAHENSHDAHYFSDPAAIISGTVRPPVVYIENQKVLLRHAHAFLIQQFFHSAVPPSDAKFDLMGSLGTVEQFLTPALPSSLDALRSWLLTNGETLAKSLAAWVPHFSHGLQAAIPEVSETIRRAIVLLPNEIAGVLPVNELENREELPAAEMAGLQRRLDENLLEVLIANAILPRYAFPTDVIGFWVAKQGDRSAKLQFDYEPQRDLQIALSEYAPGRSLTIDKYRFTSAAIYSPFKPDPKTTLQRATAYTTCNACNWANIAEAAPAISACPVCSGRDLVQRPLVTPPGFAADVNLPRVVDRGQAISYAGETDRARLEMQDPPGEWSAKWFDGRLRVWNGSRILSVVNAGIDGRGFRICGLCGRAEPEHGRGFTDTKLTKRGVAQKHVHPLDQGVSCNGVAGGPYFLGHRFPTDTLLLRLQVESPMVLGSRTAHGLLLPAARMALTSLVEAICLAASRVLQIEEGELSGWWTPLQGGSINEAQIYLYDLLPGGAGYARAVGQSLTEVMAATEILLAACDCESSCYRCIRHFGNTRLHGALDRHLARALLMHIQQGAVPQLEPDDKKRLLCTLSSYLDVRGVNHEVGADVGGRSVPAVVDLHGRSVWIDVHHPLVGDGAASAELAAAVGATGANLVTLDAHALQHNLPHAIRQLQLP
jgi:ATP-dependent helicase YprA (DUF1998 family)